MQDKFFYAALIVFVVGMVYFFTNLPSTPSTTSQDDDKMAGTSMKNTGPEMIIDTDTLYTVELETSAGVLRVVLFADKVPYTANNFVSLVQEGFYDGVRFHRVIEDFMIQSGDPNSKDLDQRASWGTGGPGYAFDDEKFDEDYTRGTLAMANSGPNTNGSQFFIMHADADLPKAYIVFGRIEAGDAASFETLDKIATAEVTAGLSGEASSPANPVVILKARVL